MAIRQLTEKDKAEFDRWWLDAAGGAPPKNTDTMWWWTKQAFTWGLHYAYETEGGVPDVSRETYQEEVSKARINDLEIDRESLRNQVQDEQSRHADEIRRLKGLVIALSDHIVNLLKEK